MKLRSWREFDEPLLRQHVLLERYLDHVEQFLRSKFQDTSEISCKHEPWDLNIDKMIDGDFVMLTYTKRDGVMTTVCKCGARIRAKQWVEV